jgi:solute carrier family 25 S-adenosylmethionine transporter 26
MRVAPFLFVCLFLLALVLPPTESASLPSATPTPMRRRSLDNGGWIPRRPALANNNDDNAWLLRGGAATTTTTTPSFTAWVDGLKSALASALAAACVKTLLQPIDAVKTVQQYHQAGGSKESLTILAACREIWQLGGGGLGKFYAGLGVTVFGAMPGVALYFGIYQYCKKKFSRTTWGVGHPRVAVALSAAVGNSIASFSRVPYEVLKQKLQTGAYATTWEALRAAAASPSAMLFPPGGVAIQMIRDVPYAVVTLLVYETLQGAFSTGSAAKERDFCLGGVAGGIGSWVTNPMDVVKTRLQTNSALYGGSVAICAQTVWKEGGAAAFLRGSVPRLVHKVPANAFFFLFYEGFRRLFRVEEAVQKQKQQQQGQKQ